MEAELVALASSGATTLVALMVTDGWERARERFGSLLRRSSAAAEAELDASRARVLADPGGAHESARQQWRTELRAVLAEHPESVGELRAILGEFPQEGEKAPVRTEIHGGEFHGPMHLGSGTQINNFGPR
ncbi:hypothetical protein ACWGIN_04635 [Streptomyces sp. NPDC054861]